MTDDDNVEFVLQKIQRTELQQGDVLVLSTRMFLKDEEIQRLKDQIKPGLPPGVRVIVMDGGLTVDGILRGQA